MAVKRVDSAAVGAGTGDTWADAYTTLQAGLTGAGVGGYVLLKSTSTETYAAASQTLTSPGTASAPVTVITTDGTDTVYQAPAAANYSVTFAGGDVTLLGSVIWVGPWISVNDDVIISGASELQRFLSGTTLQLTGTGSLLSIGGGSQSRTELIGCALNWSNAAPGTGYRISSPGTTNGASILIDGVAITDAGNPTSVIKLDHLRGVNLEIRNTDLNSGVWTGTLIDANYGGPIRAHVQNCNVHASLTLTGTQGALGEVTMVGTDDGTANDLYQQAKYNYYGTLTVDDANYNDAGATDGTQRISWKVITTANAVPFYRPFYTPWITGWVNATGSTTFAIEYNTDNVALKTDEIWIELEYLGTAADTKALTANDRLSPISGTTIVGTASGANQASGSSTWTSPGITTDLVQQVSTTQTVNRVGPYRARVAVAKASATVWIDPYVNTGSTPSRWWMGEQTYFQDEGGAGGGLMRNPAITKGGMV